MNKFSILLRSTFIFRKRNDFWKPLHFIRRNISLDNSVYEVNFNSCGNIYKKWQEEGKFRSVPIGDLSFRVSYVDTRKCSLASQERSVPTVLALHGAPGSYKDFAGLATYLHEKGARVVSPNFPDFTVFEPGVFRHSAEERAQFIQDFLKTLSIQKIDTLIVHSSAIYPGLLLCLMNSPKIKSLVMLNPATHTYDMKVTKELNFFKLMICTSEVPILYKMSKVFGPSMMRMMKIPVRLENYADPLLAATAALRGDIPMAQERFLQLAQNRFPILYAFSDDDKIIGKETSYSLANLLGCSNSDVYVYDAKSDLKQKGRETSSLKVLSFEIGSHYVLWKHPEVMHKEIYHFMSKLCQSEE